MWVLKRKCKYINILFNVEILLYILFYNEDGLGGSINILCLYVLNKVGVGKL